MQGKSLMRGRLLMVFLGGGWEARHAMRALANGEFFP